MHDTNYLISSNSRELALNSTVRKRNLSFQVNVVKLLVPISNMHCYRSSHVKATYNELLFSIPRDFSSFISCLITLHSPGTARVVYRFFFFRCRCTNACSMRLNQRKLLISVQFPGDGLGPRVEQLPKFQRRRNPKWRPRAPTLQDRLSIMKLQHES